MLGMQEDEVAALTSLFDTNPQPEQPSLQPSAAQLVTVVITIHDDALQQALQQAQADLRRSQAQAAQLQTQSDALRAELQQAVPALSAEAPVADSAVLSHEMHEVVQQLEAARQQAGVAAAQHAADVETVSRLQRQVSQQGDALAEEQGANQELRRQLEAAQAAAAESAGTMQRLR